MRPEGELQVTLALRDGRVAGCDIVSTRPDVARLLLQGRPCIDVQAALPRLFVICGASQAAAGALAMAAAQGRPVETHAMAAAVADETLRETAHRVLLDWPRVLGVAPSPAAIDAVRAVRATGPLRPGAATRERIARAVFGMSAVACLSLDSANAFAQWLADAPTAAALFVARAAQQAQPVPDEVPLLAGAMLAADVAAWAQQAEHDAAFIHAPLWQGAPAETGPLARWPQDPLLRALSDAGTPRLVLRLAARLRELALQLGDPTGKPLASGALRLGEDTGLAWVENARGLLVHLASVRDDRTMLYRIVAPTDWNFHPQGALARALHGSVAAGATQLERRARLLVDGLDPCVACSVEITGA
jgi:hypothetical protein